MAAVGNAAFGQRRSCVPLGPDSGCLFGSGVRGLAGFGFAFGGLVAGAFDVFFVGLDLLGEGFLLLGCVMSGRVQGRLFHVRLGRRWAWFFVATGVAVVGHQPTPFHLS